MADRRPAAPRFAYKADRLKPLRAFCQTARLGSVSRAAEALYVSQPAITLQLQALERELGVKLLERSGRRLVPTRDVSGLSKASLPENDALPRIDVDSETFAVHVDGDLIEPEPAAELPMAQRYFLF